MIFECIFDITLFLFAVLLDRINFNILAIRVVVGFFLNIVSFALTATLNSGTKGPGNDIFFWIIVIFITIIALSVCICIVVDRKTKYYFHMKRLQTKEMDAKPQMIQKLKEYVSFELIISYKRVELLFDLLLLFYGFHLSNWSPDKDVVCIIAVVASSIDLLLNLSIGSSYVWKLIKLVEGQNGKLLTKDLIPFLLKIILRTVPFVELSEYVCSEKDTLPVVFPTNACAKKGDDQSLFSIWIDEIKDITFYKHDKGKTEKTEIQIDNKKYKLDNYPWYNFIVNDCQKSDQVDFFCKIGEQYIQSFLNVIEKDQKSASSCCWRSQRVSQDPNTPFPESTNNRRVDESSTQILHQKSEISYSKPQDVPPVSASSEDQDSRSCNLVSVHKQRNCSDEDNMKLVDSDGVSGNEFYVILDHIYRYDPNMNLDEFVREKIAESARNKKC